jgi:hypothetical protein
MKPELGVALSNLLDVIGHDNVEGQCFFCENDSGKNPKWKRKINLVERNGRSFNTCSPCLNGLTRFMHSRLNYSLADKICHFIDGRNINSWPDNLFASWIAMKLLKKSHANA